MKYILRNLLLNMAALLIVAHFLPGLVIEEGFKGIIIGSAAFMVANVLLNPLMKLVLLPLNLLTLGLFAWLSNVLTLYLLVTFIPTFKLIPFDYPGTSFGVITVPPFSLTTFHVAVLASLMIALIIHFTHWLTE